MTYGASQSQFSELFARAEHYAKKQQFAAARETYQKILQEAPNEPHAVSGLAIVTMQNNDDAAAISLLEGAILVHPSNARLLGLLGVAHKRRGNLQLAIQYYQKALAIAPKDHATISNLARALRETGQLALALAEFQRATELAPNHADTWSMLSNAAREYAQLDLALAAANRALAINHHHAEAHLNRGAALQRQGSLEDALVSYYVATQLAKESHTAKDNFARALSSAESESKAGSRKILELLQGLIAHPHSVDLLLRLGRLEESKGNSANALVCFERSLRISQTPETLTLVARLLCDRGNRKHAKEYASHALVLDSGYLPAHRLLGLIWSLDQEPEQAEKHWRHVVAEKPLEVAAWVNLGVSLTRQGRPIEATKLLENAIRLNPKVVEAYINLGTALSDQGRFADARVAYARGLALAPNMTELFSNLLFSMHFDPSVSADEIYREHCRLGARIEAMAKPISSPLHINREKERPLRIGLVSPDFREHPVAYLLEPILREHDPQRYVIRCYSDVRRPDAVTSRISTEVQGFVNTAQLSDEAFAKLILSDKIDLLIDLTGHTAHNRLRVFALKPSPVSASWLGYFNTTGLSRIDYRITDEATVPHGGERLYVEEVVRMPRTANCYLPPRSVQLGSPPFLARNHLTFGCFNNPAKITHEVTDTFARILHRVDNSRLMLKYGAFSDPEMRRRYLSWFSEAGIAPERIELALHSSITDYLRSFSEIDIALDPFPYSGETTALHTLWMGVPLVALEGETAVQRLATRVLRIAGFHAWVARSRTEYEDIAVELSRDHATLSARNKIRATLQASPFMDYPGVTREFESALRSMWHGFCDKA